MEKYNQILANHMISTLNSMNDNIQTLTGVLEARGCWKRKLERKVRLQDFLRMGPMKSGLIRIRKSPRSRRKRTTRKPLKLLK